ncbi:SMP-30/gluconolactonase/LRE family protein [Microbacteriaceae bacterium VKM Ac-2855]|nr:SMP-30/gluconolactonase/LRE family protein [Microbacteriaceae bacterium VKM Ac-2855]
MTAVEVLTRSRRDRLGESPWWNADADELWWVDILDGRTRRSTLGGAEHPATTFESEVAFALPLADGGTLVGLADGLVELTDDGVRSERWTGVIDPVTIRLNEGKTDRAGRLWFGSMHRAESEPAGRLHRWNEDGTVFVTDDRVTVANGLGWSPDGTRMFFTDSPARTIWTYDYDESAGVPLHPRPFVVDDADGFPDGLTVDTDGCIWSARWNGGRLVRYRPNGEIDRDIELPIRKPTSLAFAGADLRTLVVTSASLEPDDGELAGLVLLLDVDAQGIAEAPIAQSFRNHLVTNPEIR